MSSEHLSSRLTSAGELDRLDAFLQSLFAEIEVHLVIRDPLQTAISAWSTLVLNGGYPLEELPSPDHPLLADRCNHSALVQRWQRVFPPVKVHTYGRDVVCLLRQAFTLPEGLGSEVPNLARNPSLSHKALVEIARLNHELPVYRGISLNPERDQRIAAIVAEHADAPRFQPSPEQEEHFAAYFADSTAWIHRMFFPQREVLFS